MVNEFAVQQNGENTLKEPINAEMGATCVLSIDASLAIFQNEKQLKEYAEYKKYAKEHLPMHEPLEKREEKGTGIGLYISKKIIEAHGGQIWGENSVDGNGATFTFALPIGKKQEEQQHLKQKEKS